MSITVQEQFGRTLSTETAERLYLLRADAGEDDQDARAALEAYAPTLLLKPDGVTIDKKRDLVEVREMRGRTDRWIGIVRYRKPSTAPKEVGDSVFSFETRGGTQHITQSLETVGRYAAPGQNPGNSPQGIGDDGESIQGTDIVVPIYSFSERHYFDPSSVTNAYKATLFALTGRVNDAPFKGLAAGECLFLGAAGSQRGTDPWEIDFAFAASPNVTDLSVGDITGIAKQGWEYLWVRYQRDVDMDAKLLVARPIAAYVERVYRDGNFAGLGIGT